jgi:phytol kinase
MINILIVLALYTLVFVGSEIAYKHFHFPFLASRKTAHIMGSIVSFFLPFFVSNVVTIGIGIFFTLAILISKKKYFFKSIHDKECASVGEVLFPLGIALSAAVVWPASIIAYQGSCLVLGLSDGLAGYLGSVYGKRTYSMVWGSKTIEGSIIFFISTLIIFGAYYFGVNQISFWDIFILALYTLVVTLFEAIFSRGWDNLVIPIVAGLSLVAILS